MHLQVKQETRPKAGFCVSRPFGLLLIATLVASLAEKLAVLLLRHTLATLLDDRTHEDLTEI
jgi:hypothetical protein